MIAIVNYGMGNVGSIKNMLKKVGYKSHVVEQPEELDKATLIILPGVGSFDNAMLKLSNLGFTHKIIELTKNSPVKFLGICLGMQLLAGGSEEGKENGLGLIPGKVLRFPKEDLKLKIPHMGWNTVQPVNDNRLFKGFSEIRFYFVHSYYFKCNQPDSHSIGITNYGIDFTSMVQKDNVTGVQFHPEKSHLFGMDFFRNYLNQNYVEK